MTNWSAYPGPEGYKPERVDDALEAVRQASTTGAADTAHSNMLFAIGNNHAGTLYPVVVAAIPSLLDIALRGDDFPSRTAFAILSDLISFDPDPGYEEFADPSGKTIPLKQALLAKLRSERNTILDVLREPTRHEATRIMALDLMEHFDDDPAELAGALRAMAERIQPGQLRLGSEKILDRPRLPLVMSSADYEATAKAASKIVKEAECEVYFPILEPGEQDECLSKLGGWPTMPPKKPFPKCGVCRLPMKMLLQLDLEDILDIQGIFVFFVCAAGTCGDTFIPSSFGSYPKSESKLRRVRAPLNCFSIVDWRASTETPHPIDWDRRFNLDRHESDLAAELLDEPSDENKLWGYPAWIQYARPSCQRCRGFRPLFQISSDNPTGLMFGDMGRCWIWMCDCSDPWNKEFPWFHIHAESY